MCHSYLSRNHTIGLSVHCICSPSVVLLDCSHMLSSCLLSLMFPLHGPHECTYILLMCAFFFCRGTQTQICLQEYIPVHMWLSSMKVTPGCIHVQLRFIWWRWPHDGWFNLNVGLLFSLDITRTDSDSYPAGYHPLFLVFWKTAFYSSSRLGFKPGSSLSWFGSRWWLAYATELSVQGKATNGSSPCRFGIEVVTDISLFWCFMTMEPSTVYNCRRMVPYSWV